MSDFDKEAEREKLREKYEQDKQKREATEQMSELLLQGATMTNAHCSECGDPIFRYDGQEFCPTCEKPVDRDTEESDEDGAGDQSEIQVTSPSDDARVTFGDDGDAEDSHPQDASRRAATTPADPGASTDDRAGDRPVVRDRANSDTSAGESRPGTGGEQPTARSGDADLTTAHESLVRTLTRFAREAEATEDPRQARESLEAAREAAETLSALRR